MRRRRAGRPGGLPRRARRTHETGGVMLSLRRAGSRPHVNTAVDASTHEDRAMGRERELWQSS